jgi:hypothetical protein
LNNVNNILGVKMEKDEIIKILGLISWEPDSEYSNIYHFKKNIFDDVIYGDIDYKGKV